MSAVVCVCVCHKLRDERREVTLGLQCFIFVLEKPIQKIHYQPKNEAQICKKRTLNCGEKP